MTFTVISAYDINASVGPSFPNSLAARTTFLSFLTNTANQDFESYTSGVDETLDFVFSNGIECIIDGGIVESTGFGPGRFATSPVHYYETDTDNFIVEFFTPVAALGFYATDIGDFGGVLTLHVLDSNGDTTDLIVPTVPDTSGDGTGPANGSCIFYGIYSTDTLISSITFSNSIVTDGFGFDDFVIGDVGSPASGFNFQFSELKDANYRDWHAVEDTDFKSFLDTWWAHADDTALWAYAPYINTFIDGGRFEEQVVDETSTPIVGQDNYTITVVNTVAPACTLTPRWEWTVSPSNRKTEEPIELYRQRTGQDVIEQRNKIRGKGRALQLHYESEAGKPFNLLAWSVNLDRNSQP